MNIFKVLASRQRFPEPQMSVLLGWLMHPKMEHGLGKHFLEHLISDIINDDKSEILQQLSNSTADDVVCIFEDTVNATDGTYLSRLDIVCTFGDYVFAIENKLYDESIEDGQLQREYTGLCVKYPDKKIFLVFLVPEKSPLAEDEYNSLLSIVDKPNRSFFVIWSETVCRVVDHFKENANKHSMPFQTAYILDSLREFIKDDFDGYDDFIQRRGWNGTASDFPKCTLEELRTKTKGFVGIAAYYAKLKNMSKSDLLKATFQYDDSNDYDWQPRNHWYRLQEFLRFANERLSSDYDIDSSISSSSGRYSKRGSKLPGYLGKLKSAEIYSMVKKPDFGTAYIGIKSGRKGLMKLTREEIAKKSWQMTTGEQPNPKSAWITGETYRKIYEEKFSL